MILYNVTCLVEDSIREEWLKWMKEVHLPEVMATGKFVSHKMYKIDPHDPSDTGTSYSIQYLLNSREDYHDYAENHGPALKAKTLAKYGDSVMAFRTILEEV
jgi:hypothetical protein